MQDEACSNHEVDLESLESRASRSLCRAGFGGEAFRALAKLFGILGAGLTNAEAGGERMLYHD